MLRSVVIYFGLAVKKALYFIKPSSVAPIHFISSIWTHCGHFFVCEPLVVVLKTYTEMLFGKVV